MSLSQRARQKIEAQIVKHFSSIEKCILRNDSDLAVYKFNELIEFKTLLDQDDINERFDELFENLMKNLNKEKAVCIKKFNQIIENHHCFPHQKVEDEKPSDEPVVLESNYPTYPTAPIPYVSSVIGNPRSLKIPLTIGLTCSFTEFVTMDGRFFSLFANSFRTFRISAAKSTGAYRVFSVISTPGGGGLL